MKLITENFGVAAAIVIIVLSMLVYNSFFKTEMALYAPDVPSGSIRNEALQTLSTLENVSFNSSLLSSQGYQQLTDFSTVIPTQSVGRPNPFNPIGK